MLKSRSTFRHPVCSVNSTKSSSKLRVYSNFSHTKYHFSCKLRQSSWSLAVHKHRNNIEFSHRNFGTSLGTTSQQSLLQMERLESQANLNNNNDTPEVSKSFDVQGLRPLDALNFDNSALKNLPLDPVEKNYVRRNVKGAVFSKVMPSPVENPRIVAFSGSALELLDVDTEKAVKDTKFAEYFSGNTLLTGSEPAAHCYCGHQFGYFSGQLGDGRAMYLGEVVNRNGERWEIQLKGAGKTPYSRDADGRAVLRSSIREFLASEAMYHLGVPTTRAGTLVTSDSYVIRDIKYDGHPIRERATIVSRIAPTFIRFGSFQICLPRDPITQRGGPSAGLPSVLRSLVTYTIKYQYPHIWKEHKTEEDSVSIEMVKQFFKEVVERTAVMTAEWMAVGFAHGVLNTDNMSILGVTIDYGPFGFLDDYDPNFICNGSDNGGRYSFINQVDICKWNLSKLMESLGFVVDHEELEPLLELYDTVYKEHYINKMRKKLGLVLKLEGDQDLVDSLLSTMQQTGADYTNTMRSLNKIPIPANEDELESSDESSVNILLQFTLPVSKLVNKFTPRIPPQQLHAMISMAQQNPSLLQLMGQDPEFLIAELKRVEKWNQLKKMDADEKKKKDAELWNVWIKRYKRRLWLEVQGKDWQQVSEARTALMNSNNPKYILRNYIAQNAIEKAENGDLSEVLKVHQLLKKPFEEQPGFESYEDLPPDWASELCVT